MCVCVCVGGWGAERQESMCVYNDLGACDYEKSTLSSKMILISSDLPTWEHICSRAICGRSCCLILAISKIFFTEISATICSDTHDRAHDTQGHTHRHAYARAHTHTHTRQPAAQPGRTVSQRAQIPNTRSMWPSTHPVDRCTCLYVSRYKHIDAFHMFICIYMFICRAPTPSIDAHMYTYVCIT